jgi:N-acyl-L-homoserine lactone synthetase
MIEAINIHNVHLFNTPILPSLHQLRHRIFIERTGYEVQQFQQMEYDQYDTIATTHLIYRDENGQVRGTSRLAPTDRPYMIKDIWPHMVTYMPLPQSHTVWESSRFGVDSSLPPEARRMVVRQLACAGLEFGLMHNVEYMIGVMPPLIWKYVFKDSGWPVEFIGDILTIKTGDKSEKVVPAKMPIKKEYLEACYKILGSNEPVLRIREDKQYKRA